VNEDEDSIGESEDNQVKSPCGRRKASSFESLPMQRPEKKSKSMYKKSVHKADIDDLLSHRIEVVYEEEMESLPISKSSLTAW